MNGSDMESDLAGSDNNDINDIDSEKLDASHREILEKLKRQEQEEREEIERELKEAQREALVRARQQDELRAQELRAQELQAHEEGADRDSNESSGTPTQTEIKTQRPQGLLAQHGLSTKSHSHAGDKDRDRINRENNKDSNNSSRDLMTSATKDRERSERDRMPEHLSANPLEFPHPAFLDRRTFAPSPPSLPTSPPSQNGPPGSRDSTSGSPLGSSTPGHHWTFEEQFKQVGLL